MAHLIGPVSYTHLMLRSKFDVTNLIKKSGKNVIAVLITDADQKKTRKAKDPYGVACSPDVYKRQLLNCA